VSHPVHEVMEKDINESAIRLLARREHSQTELRRKLEHKGFAAQDINSTLADLSAQNLLSDRRFTEAFVLNRRERGNGPLRIRAELQHRGITGELIEQHLDPSDPAWLALAERVRHKKFGEAVPADYKGKMQQAQFLANRGFSHEQIRRVLDSEFETG